MPRLVASAGAAVALVMAVVCPAAAQSSTTGALEGVVSDAELDVPLAGVAVVVSGPALVGTQEATTDFAGAYRITELPPGRYLVSFQYGNAVARAREVRIWIGATTPLHHKLKVEGVVYEFDGERPPIDSRDAKRVTLIDRTMLTKGVIPGDGLEGALGIAPGSGHDGLGTGFGGSGSLENRTSVDGMDTTGLTYGEHGLGVPIHFVEQVEVVTGGYNAEFGRATGGHVMAVTRSGGNRLSGEVFTRVTPGFLVAGTGSTPSEASAIDARSDLAMQGELGFDLGGPIIKDRLWFFVGVAPQITRSTITRTTKRLTDCRAQMDEDSLTPCDPDQYADGTPDRDPLTGFRLWEEVDRNHLYATTTKLPVMAKLSGALAAEHQGQLSLIVVPTMASSPGIRGAPAATSRDTSRLTTDAVFKWSSKLHGGDTEVQTVLGWHRSALRADSIDDAVNDDARENLYYGNLGTWSMLGHESARTRAGCTDGGGGDVYPFITNCPDEGEGYAIGGPGGLIDETEQRLSARLLGTRRARLGGSHEIKGGIDVEDASLEHLRGISGGALYDIYGAGFEEARVLRWVRLAPPTDPSGFDELCRDTGLGTENGCSYLTEDLVRGHTLSTALFLRDSYQPVPNLTFNVGLRYEQQRLRYADALQGSLDPFTGNRLGTNAMVLDGMWAPRAGVVWDWTKEGRSRAFAHWGRFYEAIPMDINNRSFGGETLYEQRYALEQCGASDPGTGMPRGGGCSGTPANGESVYGSGVLVAPGVKAQFMDEQLAGAELEVLDNTTVGIAWQRRSLGRILEDLSVDGAQTYILANPGEWSADAEADLEAQIAGADPEDVARLQAQLEQFRAIRGFDKPRRDYTAVQLTGTRRQGRNLLIQASYTYSRLRGNYPGLYSADNGQIDPNISSQFDLIELLANRDGSLPADRPHYLKVDGYWTKMVGRANAVTSGVRARVLSGTPVSALARHHRYGPDESFLLPRGALGRGDVDWGIDLHLGLSRKLSETMELEVYADLFNLFNRQGVFEVVQRYSDDPANPIVGGAYQDLVFAKQQDTAGGETSDPLTRYPGFRAPAVRYAPLSARLGARLIF